MEFIVVIAIGVALFLGIRMLLQRQAQRLNQRIEDGVTPENARIAVKLLTDEQHREVYRAIAAEDGHRALALFKQATGGNVKDCIIAVQALHRYPQAAPSELSLADEDGASEAGEDRRGEVLDGELVEDVIDGVRDEVDPGSRQDAVQEDDAPETDQDGSEDGRIAEADPETGEIVGENSSGVPDIPGGAEAPATEEDVDERARRLMQESGFDPDAELTIPEDWAEKEEELAGFHLEVQRGEEKITLSHEDLEPWVHDQLYALLRDDHVDEAAELLAEHSPLTTEEAHKFLVVFKNQG